MELFSRHIKTQHVSKIYKVTKYWLNVDIHDAATPLSMSTNQNAHRSRRPLPYESCRPKYYDEHSRGGSEHRLPHGLCTGANQQQHTVYSEPFLNLASAHEHTQETVHRSLTCFHLN
jgi:hypothetical protein